MHVIKLLRVMNPRRYVGNWISKMKQPNALIQRQLNRKRVLYDDD